MGVMFAVPLLADLAPLLVHATIHSDFDDIKNALVLDLIFRIQLQMLIA